MADQDAIALVFARNAFYRRMHFMMLAIFAFTLIVIVVLAILFTYLYRNPTRPLYFATDNVGRLVPIIPVTQPNMKPEEVLAWTIEGVEAAFTYDFINYRSQLQVAQKYFTAYGWQNYMNSLRASNNLIALTQRKMIFLAKVVSQPKLVTEGILGGAYAWKYEMPVLVTYWLPPFDDKSKFENPLLVSVIVQRQEILQSYKGLGIVQLIASLAATGQTQTPEITSTPTG